MFKKNIFIIILISIASFHTGCCVHRSCPMLPESWNANAIGGTCGLSIAKFLHRFADDIIKVNTVLFPHNLAKQLYKQNPDRVIIYRDEKLYYYSPSERES